MAGTSKRQLVLEAFKRRLEAIKDADGFFTNAGDYVSLWERKVFGTADPDEWLVVIPGEDSIGMQQVKVVSNLQVVIGLGVKATLEEPWARIEQLLMDVKKAMELEDRTLGGLLTNRLQRGSTQPFVREPGSKRLAASIVYIAPIAEVWGEPDAPGVSA